MRAASGQLFAPDVGFHVGFDPALVRERAIGGASMGLLGMQERVTLLGGKYEAKRLPERGTEVRVRLPVAERLRGTP